MHDKMKSRNQIIAAIFLLTVFVPCGRARAEGRRLFFDSKSHMVGISGSYSEIVDGGFSAHFFKNDVPLPSEAESEYGGAYDRDALLDAFKREQTGKKILDFLFSRTGNTLSINRLTARAMENVLLEDEERASVGALSKEDILQGDDYILPILENNFIYLQRQDPEKPNRVHWILFKVMINQEIFNQVYNTWEDPSSYDQIRVAVHYVTSGKFKVDNSGQDTNNRHLRAISKRVPEFAIRGQIVGRNPIRTDVGANNGLKSRDRMFIYRQNQNAKGEMYSQKVATVRVTDLDGQAADLYTFSGGTASYKKGDVAVLRQDMNSSYLVAGQYGGGGSYGAQLTIDERISLSRGGGSTYLIERLGGCVYPGFGNEVFLVDEENQKGLYNAPLILNGALGLGYGLTFLHGFELYPYALGQVEAMMMERRDDSSQAGLLGLKLQVPVGVKLSMNLLYPLQLTAGAEYVLNIMNLSEDQPYVDHSFLDVTGYNRSGLYFSVGLRLCL